MAQGGSRFHCLERSDNRSFSCNRFRAPATKGCGRRSLLRTRLDTAAGPPSSTIYSAVVEPRRGSNKSADGSCHAFRGGPERRLLFLESGCTRTQNRFRCLPP